MNYNISKPKAPPKKYLDYKLLFIISIVITIIALFSKIFVHDAVIYRELSIVDNEKISFLINILGNKIFALILELIGRLSVPLILFLLFLDYKKEGPNSNRFILILIFSIGLHLIFTWFNFNIINLKTIFISLSEYMVIPLALIYFYIWDLLKRNKMVTPIRFFLTIAFIVASILLKIENNILLALFAACLIYFEPVRLHQAIFGALSLFPSFSGILIGLFIYFYDEYYIKRRYFDLLWIIYPIIAIVFKLLRDLILSK